MTLESQFYTLVNLETKCLIARKIFNAMTSISEHHYLQKSIALKEIPGCTVGKSSEKNQSRIYSVSGK